jgi:hypothetical protein
VRAMILNSCPLRARSHGDSRGLTGSGGQKLTDVPGKASQLTPCDCPLLCKAVLQPDGLNTDNRSRLVNRLYPQAVHTVCMRSPPNPPYHLTPNELLKTLLAYRPRNALRRVNMTELTPIRMLVRWSAA